MSTSTDSTSGSSKADSDYLGELASMQAEQKAFTLGVTKLEYDQKKFENAYKAIQSGIQGMPA